MPLDYQFVHIKDVKGLEGFGEDLDRRCGEKTMDFLSLTRLKLQVSVIPGDETVARWEALTDSGGNFKNEYRIETAPNCFYKIIGYSFAQRAWFVKDEGVEKVFFKNELTNKKIGLEIKVPIII